MIVIVSIGTRIDAQCPGHRCLQTLRRSCTIRAHKERRVKHHTFFHRAHAHAHTLAMQMPDVPSRSRSRHRAPRPLHHITLIV
jgi:hypothetical protein